jgi:hypothetical protein
MPGCRGRQNLPGTTISNLRLPAQTRALEIDYSAASLVAPEKNLFRYELEGRITSGTRREIFAMRIAVLQRACGITLPASIRTRCGARLDPDISDWPACASEPEFWVGNWRCGPSATGAPGSDQPRSGRQRTNTATS